MTQRSGILKHPLRFTPELTLKQLECDAELRLSALSTVEMTRGIKPPQRLFDLLHHVLGLHRFIKKPFGFAPGASRMARYPSWVLPATLGLLEFHIRFDRQLELPLDSLPQPL